jgi:hypothetical protein
MKTITTYTPIGEGKFAAVESVLNFDWSLGGAKPVATHATALTGIVEDLGETITFVLITYVLDAHEKAVYICKATGTKVMKDQDTISVQNLVLHIYDDPEHCNPVTDAADFTIPAAGTFPPLHEYRIR